MPRVCNRLSKGRMRISHAVETGPSGPKKLPPGPCSPHAVDDAVTSQPRALSVVINAAATNIWGECCAFQKSEQAVVIKQVPQVRSFSHPPSCVFFPIIDGWRPCVTLHSSVNDPPCSPAASLKLTFSPFHATSQRAISSSSTSSRMQKKAPRGGLTFRWVRDHLPQLRSPLCTLRVRCRARARVPQSSTPQCHVNMRPPSPAGLARADDTLMSHWQASIYTGAGGGEARMWFLKLHADANYPKAPPTLAFTSKVMLDCVDSRGNVRRGGVRTRRARMRVGNGDEGHEGGAQRNGVRGHRAAADLGGPAAAVGGSSRDLPRPHEGVAATAAAATTGAATAMIMLPPRP